VPRPHSRPYRVSRADGRGESVGMQRSIALPGAFWLGSHVRSCRLKGKDPMLEDV